MTGRLVHADSNVKSSELYAIIRRACSCGCPNPEPHPQGLGLPVAWDNCPRCGKPAVVENVGVISTYHRNPIIHVYRNFKIDYGKDGFWNGVRKFYWAQYAKRRSVRIAAHFGVFGILWGAGWLLWHVPEALSWYERLFY